MTGACATGIDAAAGTTTLSETADTKVDRNLVFGCTNTDGTTPDSSWYRVFSLAAAGIDTPFHVDHVTIGICFAVAGPGAGSGSAAIPQVDVKIGTYSGGAMDQTLDVSKITALKMTTVEIPATQITELVEAPIAVDVPGGKNLVVEVHVADRNGTGEQVDIGSTANTQSQPAYLRSPLCSLNQPTSTTAAGHADAHFIITVTGTH